MSMPVDNTESENTNPDATVSEDSGEIDGLRVRIEITVVTGDRAHEWDIRLAAAIRRILLWHYQRHHPAQEADDRSRSRPSAA